MAKNDDKNTENQTTQQRAATATTEPEGAPVTTQESRDRYSEAWEEFQQTGRVPSGYTLDGAILTKNAS